MTQLVGMLTDAAPSLPLRGLHANNIEGRPGFANMRSFAYSRLCVDVHAELTHRGCGYFLGLIYVVNPRLSRYSMGLR